MSTTTHSGFGEHTLRGGQSSSNGGADLTKADRVEIAKDICLAALVGIGIFGASIAVILSAIKF